MTLDAFLIAAVGVGVGGLLIREAWSFLLWKRSLDRLERKEWARVVKTLRNK